MFYLHCTFLDAISLRYATNPPQSKQKLPLTFSPPNVFGIIMHSAIALFRLQFEISHYRHSFPFSFTQIYYYYLKSNGKTDMLKWFLRNLVDSCKKQ